MVAFKKKRARAVEVLSRVKGSQFPDNPSANAIVRFVSIRRVTTTGSSVREHQFPVFLVNYDLLLFVYGSIENHF